MDYPANWHAPVRFAAPADPQSGAVRYFFNWVEFLGETYAISSFTLTPDVAGTVAGEQLVDANRTIQFEFTPDPAAVDGDDVQIECMIETNRPGVAPEKLRRTGIIGIRNR